MGAGLCPVKIVLFIKGLGDKRLKPLVKKAADNTGSTTTHYVRDAQGNVMSVYSYKGNSAGTLTQGAWNEQNLYGSNRIGMLTPNLVITTPLSSANYDGTNDHTEDAGKRLYELSNHLGNVMVTIFVLLGSPFYGLCDSKGPRHYSTPFSSCWGLLFMALCDSKGPRHYSTPLASANYNGTNDHTEDEGKRLYELSNHLGNVMVTISDKKIGIPSTSNSSLIDHYEADVVSAYDYYPFGMQMPGRTFNAASSYRYGFNGKEKDDEVKNKEGSQLDYGMRIYDTRLGRFLSTDPLTKTYPHLTPYQFATNRPIDGVDLDGLEYMTYTIAINKTTSKITSSTYNWYNPNQHNIHGNLGQGVLYDIRYYNEKNNSWSFNSIFRSRNGIASSGIDEYGNYMGRTTLLHVGLNGKFIDKSYDYDLPAVDVIDNLAKQHDIGYDRINAVGASSLLADWAATPIDETALNGWNNFRKNYKVGDRDPFNGQSITNEELNAAGRGATLFSGVVDIKKNAISQFMISNYGKETKKASSKFAMNRNEVNEYNYQLFLNKYMTKDEGGNWKRKEGMWNKNENGNYTGPVTSKD